jgi:serine/threonine protein kinase
MKLCKNISHPNIVQVLRLGELKNSPYYFIDMELCDCNLAHYIYQDSSNSESIPHFYDDAPLSVKGLQIWHIMRQIVSGTAFIHSQNEVHRDLKPKNGTFVY